MALRVWRVAGSTVSRTPTRMPMCATGAVPFRRRLHRVTLSFLTISRCLPVRLRRLRTWVPLTSARRSYLRCRFPFPCTRLIRVLMRRWLFQFQSQAQPQVPLLARRPPAAANLLPSPRACRLRWRRRRPSLRPCLSLRSVPFLWLRMELPRRKNVCLFRWVT